MRFCIFPKQIQQADGISTSGEAYQNLFFVIEHMILFQITVDFLSHFIPAAFSHSQKQSPEPAGPFLL
jgi:hypothetical protein